MNNISLPAIMVAELYRSSLVDTGKITTSVSQKGNVNKELKEETGWIKLGNNRKNILIIVSYNESKQPSGQELQFLRGILAACKLELDDVTIINLYDNPVPDYKKLLAEFSSKIVLLFNVEPIALNLPLSFPHFQLQAFSNNTFLSAPSLYELQHDTGLKTKLWVCLKRLFNI